MMVTLLAGCTDPGTRPTNTVKEDLNDSSHLKDPQVKDPGAKEHAPEHRMTTDTTKPGGMIELPTLMLTPAVTDLAARLRVDDSDIQVLRATAVIWNNGAVGCPKSGVDYTEALVPGFWVVLGHAGKHYSYHAARKGTLKLCENVLIDPTGAPPHGRLNVDI